MEKSGIEIKLSVTEYQDKYGNVTTKEYSFVLPVTHQLIHPDMVIHADEVGNNANIRDNGKIGGERRLTNNKKDGVKISCSVSDSRWTTLGFTTGSGVPLICVIIIAPNTITAE